jgi:hypothetical protein
MHNKLFSFLYAINIVSQAIFSLLVPVGLMILAAWLMVDRVGAPKFVYAIAIVLGFLIGLYSMVRFVMTATANLERLENQDNKDNNNDEK